MTQSTNVGRGAVFEVDLVSDRDGTVLVRKRVARVNRGVPEATTALEREIRILELMGGCHLPSLAGTGTDEFGPFVLETRAKGRPLRDLGGDTNEPIDAARWMKLAVSAVSALADVHNRADERGCLEFVHGDVSPDNVFWDEPETVTFVDLSSATFRETPIPAFPHSRGSLPYVAPELARNEKVSDAASDTYALAATLLALAVGPIIQAATEAARLVEVAERGVASNLLELRKDLPRGVREALALALRFERDERLTSSRELFWRLVEAQRR
jgi:eukaryotic-like serine/threonine-protein kinase